MVAAWLLAKWSVKLSMTFAQSYHVVLHQVALLRWISD
jgi:hypothetical protein